MTYRHIWALGSSLESLRLGYTLLANNQILNIFQTTQHSLAEERREEDCNLHKVISDKLGFKLLSLFHPPSLALPCPAHPELGEKMEDKTFCRLNSQSSDLILYCLYHFGFISPVFKLQFPPTRSIIGLEMRLWCCPGTSHFYFAGLYQTSDYKEQDFIFSQITTRSQKPGLMTRWIHTGWIF